MFSPCLPSRDGAGGSLGRVEGLRVPAQALQFRSSSLPSPVPEGPYGAEWGWHPGCTQEHLSAGISDRGIEWLISLSSSQAPCLQCRTPCPGAAALFVFQLSHEVPAGNCFEDM